MGANQSTKTLEDLTKEEVGAIVASYGAKYQEYEANLIENGMDGAFLASMAEEEFQEALDDLGIENRLHRRRLTKDFLRAQAQHRGEELPRGSNHSVSSRSSMCSTVSSEYQASVSSMMDDIERENAKLRQSLESSKHVKRRSALQKLKDPPSGTAAIVLTDIEGSTNLWEANPKVMRKALTVHDKIMRNLIAEHAGYEIKTEGDAFAVAFHEAVDAINFTLCIQEVLNETEWQPELLNLPWARDDGEGRRGIRVRASVHMGEVQTLEDACSGRAYYAGEAWEVARSLEGLAVGGQIIISSETWEAAAHMADTALGSPFVVDLGSHTVAQKKTSDDEPITINILEISPAKLTPFGTIRESKKSAQVPDSPAPSSSWVQGLLGGSGGRVAQLA